MLSTPSPYLFIIFFILDIPFCYVGPRFIEWKWRSQIIQIENLDFYLKTSKTYLGLESFKNHADKENNTEI